MMNIIIAFFIIIDPLIYKYKNYMSLFQKISILRNLFTWVASGFPGKGGLGFRIYFFGFWDPWQVSHLGRK